MAFSLGLRAHMVFSLLTSYGHNNANTLPSMTSPGPPHIPQSSGVYARHTYVGTLPSMTPPTRHDPVQFVGAYATHNHVPPKVAPQHGTHMSGQTYRYHSQAPSPKVPDEEDSDYGIPTRLL